MTEIVARQRFTAGVSNLFSSRPAGDPLCSRGSTARDVLSAYVLAVRAGRALTMTEGVDGALLSHEGWRHVERLWSGDGVVDALYSLRALGADWGAVFDWLRSVDTEGVRVTPLID